MYNIEAGRHILRHFHDLSGWSVCELGDQLIWRHARKSLGLDESDQDLPAREWFEKLGVSRYECVDMNGRNGAIMLDLAQNICYALATLPLNLLAQFDLVTNIGTSEHVEGQSHERDGIPQSQLQCFLNMRRLCKVGGYMVHHLPQVGQWLDHCRIHYRPGFGKKLAEACGDKLIESRLVTLETLNPDVAMQMVVIQKQFHADVDESFLDEIRVG